MKTAIPPVLSPYLQECLKVPSLTLLTSVLDSPANWLLTRLLTSALNDHVDPVRVILVSLWRPASLWDDLAQKLSTNLQSSIANGSLRYVDGLSTSPSGAANPGHIDLKGAMVKDLEAALSVALQSSTNDEAIHRIVLLDGLDFFLAMQHPSPHNTDIQRILLDLQTRTHSLIVTCAADSALLHNTDASATPLEYEHAILARSLAHQARWVFQLRPLETGQSKEVSGSIRASRGGSWEDLDLDQKLDEAEWLFHQRSDGDVRVWGRGEA